MEKMNSKEKSLNAFVLIPFEPEFKEIFNDLIKPALEDAGYVVSLAENINQQNILKDILIGISTADLIVADLTNNNPNVFYELGIAHTLHKPTIQLTQNLDKVPFDLRSYRIIVYSLHYSEVKEFSTRLKEVGKEARKNDLIFGNPVSDFLPEAEKIIEKQKIKRVKQKETENLTQPITEILSSGNDYYESMQLVLELISKDTKNIQDLMVKYDDLSKGKGQEYAHTRIMTFFADDQINLAISIENEVQKLSKSWEIFEKEVIELVKRGKLVSEKNEIEKLSDMVIMLKSNVINVVKSFRNSIDAINQFKGTTHDLDIAIERIIRIENRLIEQFEMVESFCIRMSILLEVN